MGTELAIKKIADEEWLQMCHVQHNKLIFTEGISLVVLNTFFHYTENQKQLHISSTRMLEAMWRSKVK